MRPTLYEFAGGEPAFLALATAHHARCLADPELNHPFSHPGQNPRHIERLAAYWAEVMGGPPTFSESYNDQSRVLQMHAGNGDMTDLGRRFVDCFVRAADDAGLPDRSRVPRSARRLHALGGGRRAALLARGIGRPTRRGHAALVVGRVAALGVVPRYPLDARTTSVVGSITSSGGPS